MQELNLTDQLIQNNQLEPYDPPKIIKKIIEKAKTLIEKSTQPEETPRMFKALHNLVKEDQATAIIFRHMESNYENEITKKNTDPEFDQESKCFLFQLLVMIIAEVADEEGSIDKEQSINASSKNSLLNVCKTLVDYNPSVFQSIKSKTIPQYVCVIRGFLFLEYTSCNYKKILRGILNQKGTKNHQRLTTLKATCNEAGMISKIKQILEHSEDIYYRLSNSLSVSKDQQNPKESQSINEYLVTGKPFHSIRRSIQRAQIFKELVTKKISDPEDANTIHEILLEESISMGEPAIVEKYKEKRQDNHVSIINAIKKEKLKTDEEIAEAIIVAGNRFISEEEKKKITDCVRQFRNQDVQLSESRKISKETQKEIKILVTFINSVIQILNEIQLYSSYEYESQRWERGTDVKSKDIRIQGFNPKTLNYFGEAAHYVMSPEDKKYQTICYDDRDVALLCAYLVKSAQTTHETLFIFLSQDLLFWFNCIMIVVNICAYTSLAIDYKQSEAIDKTEILHESLSNSAKNITAPTLGTSLLFFSTNIFLNFYKKFKYLMLSKEIIKNHQKRL
ncbi:MAG: hypothetical protein VXZ72_00285 [Chlamydiota bacterium]|nr:hypothetical protein [Chlamydiota bacterium]